MPARVGGQEQPKQLRERNRLLLEQLERGQREVRRAVLAAAAAGASDNAPRRAASGEQRRCGDSRGLDAGEERVGRGAGTRDAANRRAAVAPHENDENSPAALDIRRRPQAAAKAPHPALVAAGGHRLMRGDSPAASPPGAMRRHAGTDDVAVRKKLCDAFEELRLPTAGDSPPSTPPPPRDSGDGMALPSETPKSILKRRRIIDDNVPVASRLQHTPGWMERIGGGGRRRSAAVGASVSRCDPPVGNKTGSPAAYRRLRNVSFAKTHSHGGARDDDKDDGSQPRPRWLQRPARASGANDDALEALTLDSGNYRPTSVARAAETPRTALKRGLGTEQQGGGVRSRSSRSGSAEQETEAVGAAVRPPTVTASPYRGHGKRLASARSSVAGTAAEATAAGGRHPMLGYDWIAALLDNEETPATVAAAAQLPDDFFVQLRDFRRQNKDECMSADEVAVAAAKTPVKSPLLTPSKHMVDAQAGDLPSPSHTCIHNYTVNNRLFAKPTGADETGKSRCPVCWRARKSPTSASPGFVRVSIPRATLMTPYKVRPHRRKSFDPSDSYALSKHCLAGWENQRPPPAVVARNVDLANETSRLKTKWTSTIKEAEELAIKLKKLPLRSRDLDTTTLYTRQLRQIVDDLHNI